MDSSTRPESEAVFDALVAFRDEPPPSDPTSVGCVVAIIAIIVLVFMPVSVRFTTVAPSTIGLIGLGVAAVVVIGTLIGIFGGGTVRSGRAADVEKAVQVLVDGFPGADLATLTRAAVRVLDQSTTSAGPSTLPTFDAKEVAADLGDVLPFVVDVERILLERDAVHPCFTQLDPPSRAG
ncbi:MAG: hypothetical protein HOB12_03615 [Gemmatimonadales bacterium]|nr:hypothetical protein [Gemmatimonadales bacterium]